MSIWFTNTRKRVLATVLRHRDGADDTLPASGSSSADSDGSPFLPCTATPGGVGLPHATAMSFNDHDTAYESLAPDAIADDKSSQPVTKMDCLAASKGREAFAAADVGVVDAVVSTAAEPEAVDSRDTIDASGYCPTISGAQPDGDCEAWRRQLQQQRAYIEAQLGAVLRQEAELRALAQRCNAAKLASALSIVNSDVAMPVVSKLETEVSPRDGNMVLVLACSLQQALQSLGLSPRPPGDECGDVPVTP